MRPRRIRHTLDPGTSAAGRARRGDALAESLDLVLKNDMGELDRLLSAAEEFCEGLGASPKLAYQVGLVLDELFTNIVSYGFDDGQAHDIRVRLWAEDGTLFAELSDDGRPFDPLSEAAEPDLDADVEDRAIGGLGVHFVKTFMDGTRYEYGDGQNRLRFWKALG